MRGAALKAVEQFLLEGAPLPPVSPLSATPWGQLALRTALLIRWRRHREQVQHNLVGFHTLDGDWRPGGLLAILAANMTRVLAAAVKFRQSPAALPIDGRDAFLGQVEDLLACGRGLVLVTAHLGFWHLPGQLAETVAPAHFLHPHTGLRPIPRLAPPSASPTSGTSPDGGGDALSAAADRLRRNGIVVSLPDRPQRRWGGQLVHLLGRHVRMPSAATALSQLTGAPVLPAFCAIAGAAPVLRVGAPLLFPEDSPGRLGPLRGAVQELTDVLEIAIRRSPDQWLGWLCRWAEPVQAPRRESRQLPAGAAVGATW